MSQANLGKLKKNIHDIFFYEFVIFFLRILLHDSFLFVYIKLYLVVNCPKDWSGRPNNNNFFFHKYFL